MLLGYREEALPGGTPPVPPTSIRNTLGMEMLNDPILGDASVEAFVLWDVGTSETAAMRHKGTDEQPLKLKVQCCFTCSLHGV